MAQIEILPADLTNPQHTQALLGLLDHYARDPMGGAQGLSSYAQANLLPRLAARTDFFAFIAWEGRQAVGLINLIEGFSTFAARPLMNIHDVVVHAGWRGRGVASLLFGAAEQLARERDCCKLTLEVLEGNVHARTVYEQLGFRGFAFDPQFGQACMMEKKLP